MAVAPMFKTVLLLGLMALRGVDAEDAPKCKQAECEKPDVSSLLQSRVHASLDSRTEELKCTFKAMMEEDTNIGEPNSTDDGYMWGECEDDSAITHYLFDDDQLENFVPGDKLELTVSEVTGVDAPTAPNLPWQADNVPLYRIVSVIAHEPALTEEDHSLNEGATATKEVDVIMMICNYKDQDAFVTDETRVMNSFYQKLGEKLYSTTDGRGSFADMLEASSYGRFTAPRSKGKVVTVTINKNFPTAGCDYNGMARDCKQATRDQTHLNPDDFTYREFFIPTKGSGCRWGGLASVGCGHYSLVPRKAACQAWYRSDRPFVRAHEIGHNLGFLHAGGDSGGQFVEYGDPQASMGASYVFSSFNAANRYQGGFLHKAAGEAVEFQPDFNAGNSGTFKLQSLSKPLGEPGSDAVAVFWTCPKCVPQVSSHSRNKGGYLWLQFRGDEGYSASKLNSKYQNKVYVHLARKYQSKYYGKGTEMWQMMEKGASYTAPNSETTVTVNDIVGDLATVTISVQGTSSEYFLADGGTSCDQACQKKGGAWMCDANSLKDAAASVAKCKSVIESLGKTPQRGGQYRDDNAGCTYHPGQTGWYQVMRKDGDPGCSVVNRDRSRQRVCSCNKQATTTSTCKDNYPQCPGWAKSYCAGRWAEWMGTNCRKSCSKCS